MFNCAFLYVLQIAVKSIYVKRTHLITHYVCRTAYLFLHMVYVMMKQVLKNSCKLDEVLCLNRTVWRKQVAWRMPKKEEIMLCHGFFAQL